MLPTVSPSPRPPPRARPHPDSRPAGCPVRCPAAPPRPASETALHREGSRASAGTRVTHSPGRPPGSAAAAGGSGGSSSPCSRGPRWLLPEAEGPGGRSAGGRAGTPELLGRERRGSRSRGRGGEGRGSNGREGPTQMRRQFLPAWGALCAGCPWPVFPSPGMGDLGLSFSGG